ncbi:hypothetical protein NGRA_1557 [Nosema granulosis]|uniref:Uncharacterized protein n=1 Tax=Nosema granulosis TaxID=83296 RepID=A0A9P6H0Z3_9MICR|nr:hypothetical protein NGRA_1557 [Nosema granulosis]
MIFKLLDQIPTNEKLTNKYIFRRSYNAPERNDHCGPSKTGIFSWRKDKNALIVTTNLNRLTTQCDRMLEHDYIRRHKEGLRCIHLQLCLKYGLSRARKRRKFSFQEYVSTDRAEIRVGTRIPTDIQVKYNKPHIFVSDRVNKEILIVEVGIKSF